MMMQAINPNCIVGFSQQREYNGNSELHKTTFVAVLTKYLSMLSAETAKQAELVDELCEKEIAIKTFKSCLKSDLRSPDLRKTLREAGVVDLPETVPFSCLQFTMYQQMGRQELLPKNFTSDQLNQYFNELIKTYQLDKLIPLIYELTLTVLYKESLDLIKNGDKSSWEKVDHLQFLLAMSRGHWGNNTFTTIREWATFHLLEIRKKALEKHIPAYLHVYKLCCVCYVLLSEHHFVTFVGPNEDLDDYCLGILANTTKIDADGVENISCIDGNTHTDLIGNSPNGKYPDKEERSEVYSWEDLFQHCKTIPDCIKMWRTSETAEKHQWKIRDIYAAKKNEPSYTYSSIDFKMVMIALTDYLLKVTKKKQSINSSTNNTDLRINSFNIQPFRNETVPEKARMSGFPTPIELENSFYKFIEARVIIDQKKVKKRDDLVDSYVSSIMKEYDQKDTKEVLELKEQIKKDIESCLEKQTKENTTLLGCRFVFALLNDPAEADYTYEGILFYTNCHYGDNLIQLQDQETLSMLCEKCRKKTIQLETDLLRKLYEQDKNCYFEMLKVANCKMRARQIYPYQNIGRLKLSRDVAGKQTIELQELPSLNNIL